MNRIEKSCVVGVGLCLIGLLSAPFTGALMVFLWSIAFLFVFAGGSLVSDIVEGMKSPSIQRKLVSVYFVIGLVVIIPSCIGIALDGPVAFCESWSGISVIDRMCSGYSR